jgi:glucose-1-phosphate adenylyltransferase
MLRTMALILAGGDSPALSVLTAERTEAAVPFGGKFRIIDFTLSNCVNSGVYNVAVLTQYRPRSLQSHLGVGRPWDLDRAQGGLRVLHPSPTPNGGGWQRGTADAVRYNLDLLEEQPIDAVLLLAGDHIYKMDYRPLLEQHAQRGADLTMAVHTVSPHDVQRFGMVTTAADGRVEHFVEKPRRSESNLASMGIYVFRKQYLLDVLRAGDAVDFGRDILPQAVTNARTYAYHFQGYWADVGTVQAYYEANLALLAETSPLDLYDLEWVVHTTSADRPGAEIGPTARVVNSLLSDGVRVDGTVIGSVLSPGVVIGAGAVVRDSVILSDAVIGPGAVVDRCIIDEGSRIGSSAHIGNGDDMTPNQEVPERLNTGLTLIGLHSQVPDGVNIGRNVAVRPRSTAAAFPADGHVASGAVV